MVLKVTVPTRIGPCYPRCTPTYGRGGPLSHRLASGLIPGAVPGVNPWWDPAGEGLCIWSAYQPKGAADLAASYTDLSGNGNDAGVGVAPTWDVVNGWEFNGVNQYLTTTFVAHTDQSQSILVQFTNGVAADKYIFGGTRAGAPYCAIQLRAAAVRYWQGNQVTVAPNQTTGNTAIAGNQGYRNGVANGGPMAPAAGVGVRVYIGCRRNGVVPVDYQQAYIQALAIYDCTLTAPQVLSVVTAMAAL